MFKQLFLLVSPQSVVLMKEVLNTKQHNWIIHAIAGMGVAICVIMVKHGMDHPASKDLLFLFKNFKIMDKNCNFTEKWS